MKHRFALFILLLIFQKVGAVDECDLSQGGSVNLQPGLEETGQRAGSDLAEKLSSITGAVFQVSTNREDAVIQLKLNSKPSAPLERDSYSIRTSRDGIEMVGNSELGLQHAIWDFLYRIGYRQYFPGKIWEIIPKIGDLEVAIDVSESPAYANRRIWYGYGLWEHNKEVYRDWVKKNRMNGSFTLNTGHAYHRLIRSQQAEFDAHPEYYALLQGKRKIHEHSKLCISNPGVIEAAKRYGIEYFKSNPVADSVSVDPSDGGNWCECQNCAKLGEPNDRALILADAVAEAVVNEFGDRKYVGMYAYNYHSSPPTIPVHPNVIISVATAFIKEGMKVDDIIAGWSDKGAIIGIREYYSVNTWDRDLPGAARGSNLEYLAETIPKFHHNGARFLSAESSDNWGCNGLGYYLASRLMWDPDEAGSKDKIVAEFIDNCFGPAKTPMAQFYQLIDGSNSRARLVYEDLLARMYRCLSEARSLAANHEDVQRRIDDLILYTRHAELFNTYRRSSGPDRQQAYEAMIRHAYRIRDTYMVHSYGLYRDVHNRDKTVALPAEAYWKVPESENPWKNSARYSGNEIVSFLKEVLEKYEVVELDFEARRYAEDDLVPASTLMKLDPLPPGICQVGRGKRSWFSVVEKAPAKIRLNLTGGLIKHYRDRGNVRVQLYKVGGASETGEEMTLVAEDFSVPPDGVERVVELPVTEPGVYRINLDDGSDMTKVTWSHGQLMTIKMSLDDYPKKITGRWTLYFYVPENTQKIGIYSAASAGQLLDPEGNVVLELKQPGGEFLSVPVPEGMSGRLWKVSKAAGGVRLLNVPPFLAQSPEELLLPIDSVTF